MFPQANSPSATAQTRKVNRINDNHQQIASATTSMKRLLFLAISAFSISANALPTYEPFTEYAAAITANGGSIDLATNGCIAPSGE